VRDKIALDDVGPDAGADGAQVAEGAASIHAAAVRVHRPLVLVLAPQKGLLLEVGDKADSVG